MLSARALAVAFLAASAALVAVVLAACDSSGTIVGGADASEELKIVYFDGPTPFEAAVPDAGASDGQSDATPQGDASLIGFIELSEVPVGGGEFTAAFLAGPVAPLPGCTSDTLDGGSCVVTTCTGHAAADAGVVSLATAGALEVTGGVFGDAGVAIGPDTFGSYLYNTTGPMFSPGDALSVSGAGATVPAFATQTIAGPGAITLMTPSLGDAGALVVPTTADLPVTWAGGVSGDRVIFTLTAFFTGGASASTACSWDASGGQGTIPASQLAPLAAGTPQAGGSTAVWYQQAQTSFQAGDWEVTLRADIHGGALAAFQ